MKVKKLAENDDLLWEKANNILKALVYFASQKGKKKLPTIEEFVLSEVVAATVEYITGKKNYSGYFQRCPEGTHVLENYDWQIKTNCLINKTFSNLDEKKSAIIL